MKTAFALMMFCAMSLAQTPMTKDQLKTQKADCAKATKLFKKATNNPNLSQDDFKTLTNALDDACGMPEEYATATSDCENAIQAVDQDVKKNGPDPTSSRADLNALLATMHRACGLAEHSAAEPPKQVDNNQDHGAPLDVHGLVAQSSTALNREIAQGNRLIAHFKKAQTWEGVDADHPEAVALRGKISEEEKELRETVSASGKLTDRIDVDLAQKSCSPEELEHWVNLVKEATGILGDVKTQQDRYHALGY